MHAQVPIAFSFCFFEHNSTVLLVRLSKLLSKWMLASTFPNKMEMVSMMMRHVFSQIHSTSK